MEKIIVKPFDWNDNFSEVAQEDFSMIQKSLSYGTATSIGMALAKLKLLEKQGCKVEPQERSDKDADKKCTYKETGCGSCKRQFDCPIEADKSERTDA